MENFGGLAGLAILVSAFILLGVSVLAYKLAEADDSCTDVNCHLDTRKICSELTLEERDLYNCVEFRKALERIRREAYHEPDRRKRTPVQFSAK